MSFLTDKQTLDDLNLLGKYKTGSLFNLFNRVSTRGGELLLEEMFRVPLTEAPLINERAQKIKYVQQLGVKLSIDWDLTELASQYLTEHRPAYRLSSYFNCYKEKTQEVLYRSDKLHLRQKMIHAMQETLYAASQFLGQLIKRGEEVKRGQPARKENGGQDGIEGGVAVKGEVLQRLQGRLDQILNAPALKQIKAKFPYTVGQTAALEFIFLHKHRQDLEELLHLIYELDVYCSVAEVAESKGLRYPQVTERGASQDNGYSIIMEVRNLRHPSLSGAIGNDLVLTRNENLLFLTGANMAGKSTWMKTLGVSFYLAHMGFPVAADSMRFLVMEGVFTSINVPDDISAGWSHFYAEVMRVKHVAQEVSSGKRLFVLFDELFKGTNVKDAYDATLAVTKRLAGYHSCAFVISTHIIEVGEALTDDARIQFRYMPTVMEGAVPRYTYRLTEGITEDRQGMVIIENEKILEMLS